MRKPDGTKLFILDDHLGGSNRMVDENANAIPGELQLYKPWGEGRGTSSITLTKYQYTGQFNQAETGLYWYNSRWYDPALGRFVQPDSLIPDYYNTLDWDRYSYGRNNPIRYRDPSGHKACATGDSPDTCTDYPNQTLDELTRHFGLKFINGVREENCTENRHTGEDKCVSRKEIKWTEAQMWGVIRGVVSAVAAVNKIRGEAGKMFYGLAVTVNDTSVFPVCEAGAMGFTCSGAPSFRLVVHELGHILNNRLGGSAYTAMGNASIWTESGLWVTGRAIRNGTGAWLRTDQGYVSTNYPDVMHWTAPGDSAAIGEEFADMYMNWVFNSFAPDEYGLARWTWMNQTMSNLLH